MSKEVVFTENAPKAVGPYVQAVSSNGVLYCSGQLGINPIEGKIVDGIEAQTHASMKNIGAILTQAGISYSSILKTTIFLTDMDDFAVVNKIYESYFGGIYPARSCIQVAKLPLGGLVEIECIAELIK